MTGRGGTTHWSRANFSNAGVCFGEMEKSGKMKSNKALPCFSQQNGSNNNIGRRGGGGGRRRRGEEVGGRRRRRKEEEEEGGGGE